MIVTTWRRFLGESWNPDYIEINGKRFRPGQEEAVRAAAVKGSVDPDWVAHIVRFWECRDSCQAGIGAHGTD